MEILLKRLMDHFNWKRVAILASTDDIWQIAANLVKIVFAKNNAGIEVAHFHSFIPGRLHVLESRIDGQADRIREATHKAKIFILLCSGGDIRDIMLNFLDLGLLNGKNAFITVHLPKRSYIGNNTWMGDDGRDDDAKKAYEGVLNIEQKFGTAKTSGDKVQSFLDRVRLRLKKEPFNIDLPDNDAIEAYAGTMYDAVLLYAIALNETLSEGGSKRDGLLIASKMYNRQFEGVAGTVYIDNKGDRDPDYTIQTLINDRFQDIAHYTRYNDNFTIRDGVTIIWPGGFLTPPKDSPDCGWSNELCEEKGDSTTYVIIACCTISGVLFVTMVFVFVYRKLTFELDLAQNQSWKVKEDEIIFRENPYGPSLRSVRSSQNKSVRSFKSIQSGKDESVSHISIKSAKSTDTKSSARWSLHEPVFSSAFTSIAMYKAEMVAVKRMKKKEISISRKILIEVKQARELRHEYINPFIGICMESRQILILSKYLKRGSLQDLLDNENFKLDEVFILSLVRDVATGMTVLHSSPVQVHGRLKSSNCLIDSRWVCKIGDWGLGELRSSLERLPARTEAQEYNDMLWCAPEHINNNRMDSRGSQKGDVYSYGIILQEIAMKASPYCMCTDMSSKEVVQKVSAREDPPFRPVVPVDACKTELRTLMQQCWEDDPDKRPHFNKILDKLRKVMGRDVNIMDNMINLIERHADNLEELVEERTRQLMEEKKKTDRLLYKMLPASVADQLKRGKSVTPELFDEVTIYFSDVVAFMDLASDSTPMEIVTLLNDLYLALDKILANYDVYKVESIGDCLLVVSGLPVRNGIRHAGEIATMALDILSLMTHFTIRHRPQMKLQLRVGLHSGPCVSAVVGIQMPRFCLFGDTVNVASRMETTGQALKIHISENCYNILKEIGGYIFEKRGDVYIKGRGFWKTYWLTGKEGYSKSLPHVNAPSSTEQQDVFYAS
ncbi:Atrial natriuretic peptide receptor 1 [Exaiptasia diaphana]|nr:Atrial natriuretic peptide receptor 1 [Exaiptasia diaphana]